jgi:hypothetical protein
MVLSDVTEYWMGSQKRKGVKQQLKLRAFNQIIQKKKEYKRWYLSTARIFRKSNSLYPRWVPGGLASYTLPRSI